MIHPHFIIQRSKDDQYYFNLTASNAEIILTSETFTSRAGAENGIDSVKENAPYDARYDRLPSGSQFYFVLRAANGEVLGTSEMYNTRAARDQAIDSVKKHAPVATLGQ